MTAIIFRWVLDPESGVINLFLHKLGLIDAFGGNPADWLGTARRRRSSG